MRRLVLLLGSIVALDIMFFAALAPLLPHFVSEYGLSKGAAGVLSAGHARALLGLEDQAAMERLAQRIVAEGLSVRAIEEIVALGDGPTVKSAKRRPRPGGHTSELNDLAARLGDRLDTRVAIALGRNKGRLSIDFASVEDLNRIIGLLGPEMKGVFQDS